MRNGVANLKNNERHIVDGWPAPPSCDTIDNFLIHDGEGQASCSLYNFPQTLDSKHLLLGIKAFR